MVLTLQHWKLCLTISDESGSKIFDLVWVRKISPKNVKFFIFSPFGSKKSFRVGSKVGQPHIYCGSKACLGRVGSGPISTYHHLNEFDDYKLKIKRRLIFNQVLANIQSCCSSSRICPDRGIKPCCLPVLSQFLYPLGHSDPSFCKM